jgi:hypothetical protein
MDHLALLSHPHCQIESKMKFATSTFTPFLSTDPMHGHQASAKERLFVQKFGQPGSGQPLGASKLTSVSHEITSFISDMFYYIRLLLKIKSFLKCEFALGKILALTG